MPFLTPSQIVISCLSSQFRERLASVVSTIASVSAIFEDDFQLLERKEVRLQGIHASGYCRVNLTEYFIVNVDIEDWRLVKTAIRPGQNASMQRNF